MHTMHSFACQLRRPQVVSGLSFPTAFLKLHRSMFQHVFLSPCHVDPWKNHSTPFFLICSSPCRCDFTIPTHSHRSSEALTKTCKASTQSTTSCTTGDCVANICVAHSPVWATHAWPSYKAPIQSTSSFTTVHCVEKICMQICCAAREHVWDTDAWLSCMCLRLSSK